MFVLGVTGGIGSGKSAATEIFSSLGIKIVDADVLSRVPVQKGESGLLEIEKRYGKEILLSSGDLDRKKLREIIFEKEEEKDWLENLLHPLIADLIVTEINPRPSGAVSASILAGVPVLDQLISTIMENNLKKFSLIRNKKKIIPFTELKIVK